MLARVPGRGRSSRRALCGTRTRRGPRDANRGLEGLGRTRDPGGGPGTRERTGRGAARDEEKCRRFEVVPLFLSCASQINNQLAEEVNEPRGAIYRHRSQLARHIFRERDARANDAIGDGVVAPRCPPRPLSATWRPSPTGRPRLAPPVSRPLPEPPGADRGAPRRRAPGRPRARAVIRLLREAAAQNEPCPRRVRVGSAAPRGPRLGRARVRGPAAKPATGPAA